MTSEAQANNGWMLPDPIDGYDLICLRLMIPDVREYRAAAAGALGQLAKWWNWEKSGDPTDRRATDTATMWRTLILENLFIGGCDVPITAIRIEDCVLQVQVDGADEWQDVGDLTACAVPGPPGEQGPPGQDGQDGADGVDGQDGQDGQQGPPGEKGDKGDRGSDGADGGRGPEDTTTPTDNTNDHLCAVSQALAEWSCDKFHAAIELLRASVDLGRGLLDQATDLMDALPVVGALINNVFDFIEELSTAGDFDDILGFIDDPDYRLQFACQLYCVLKANSQTDFTKQNVLDAMNTASVWNVHLPLGLPLLTAYGPAMGLFIQTLDYSAIFRTAVMHLDEESNDCELACEDCSDEGGGDAANWHTPLSSVTAENAYLTAFGTDTGISAGGGVWISEQDGGTDKEVIALITDELAVEAIYGKRYTFYVAYDHVGFYGSWQSNTFEGRIGFQYLSSLNNWYGGGALTSDSNPQLPIDGSEVLLGYYDPPQHFGSAGDPDGVPIRFGYRALNYNGWRITRIVESDV